MTPINSTGYDLKATSFKPEKKEGIKANSKEKVMSLFEDVTPFDWEDWKWQYSKRIRSKEVLKKIVNLTSSEEKGIDLSGEKLTMAIPPYVASLIDANDPNCPIRRQAIPLASELDISEDEMQDPCAEEAYSPVHGLVHRYPDRVLFLVNEMCAMYCRHCTRSRMVGDGSKGKGFNLKTYDAAFEYIKAHKEIRDVLISGGDPLLL
ncbi:MAG: hypothetical protein KKF78_05675, partial [Candidatus Omnitrophica bacterium]|nr:hypothetical protein [Candidatus Omnitrophota bacterium]